MLAQSGPTLTVSIPKKLSTNSLEISAYNAKVQEKDRIPDAIVNHKLGQPHSYYSLADKEALETQGKGYWLFSNGHAPVTQGSGTTTINTWNSAVKTNSFDFNMNVGAETNITLGYFQFAVDAGVSGGYSYEHEVGSGTSVQGVVGCIPVVSDWNANKFDWGLMMIPKTFGGQSFSLVTYWVE